MSTVDSRPNVMVPPLLGVPTNCGWFSWVLGKRPPVSEAVFTEVPPLPVPVDLLLLLLPPLLQAPPITARARSAPAHRTERFVTTSPIWLVSIVGERLRGAVRQALQPDNRPDGSRSTLQVGVGRHTAGENYRS